MKTSATNDWSGEVVSTHLGAVNAEVRVRLVSGHEVIAGVSLDAVRRLGLTPGQRVRVAVKASMIFLALDLEGYVLSARNQMSGEIEALLEGPVSALVTVRVSSDTAVRALITQTSLETLGLKQGQTVTAFFKAGAVILSASVSGNPEGPG